MLWLAFQSSQTESVNITAPGFRETIFKVMWQTLWLASYHYLHPLQSVLLNLQDIEIICEANHLMSPGFVHIEHGIRKNGLSSSQSQFGFRNFYLL